MFLQLLRLFLYFLALFLSLFIALTCYREAVLRVILQECLRLELFSIRKICANRGSFSLLCLLKCLFIQLILLDLDGSDHEEAWCLYIEPDCKKKST